MDIVKWMRKNNRKIMTVVVIVLMVAFVGGTALQTVLSYRGGNKKVQMLYGQNGKIRGIDFQQAESDLQVLKTLGVPNMPLIMRSLDIALLCQTLFPEARAAMALNNQLKQWSMWGQIDVSSADIDAFFQEATGRSEINWLLLNAEAKEAGIAISDEAARKLLSQMVPALNRGASAAQIVSYLVEQQGVTEEKVIRAFADFIGILTYAKTAMSNEDITIDQLKADIARNGASVAGTQLFEGEKVNADYVQISAASLLADQEEPSAAKITEQFNAFKNITAGSPTNVNSFGFGYELPARVQLEYIILKTEDVKQLISTPTQTELEDYYRENIAQYQSQVPSDPNNPASEQITKTQPFAEVTGRIKQQMLKENTDSRANMIIGEIKDFTEAGFLNIDDLAEATTEQLKDNSIPFPGAAKKLSEKYKVALHAGKTGQLSISDLSADSYLGNLRMEGQFGTSVELFRIAFSVPEQGQDLLGRFDVPTSKMFETIGPVTNGFSYYAVVRVVDSFEPSAPESIDVSYDNNGAYLNNVAITKTRTIKENVISDCKAISAMLVAKARADELVALVEKDGWDKAVEKYNKSYKKAQVRSTPMTNKARVSQQEVDVLLRAAAQAPMLESYAKGKMDDKILTEALVSMLPAGETEASNILKVATVEAARSCYVVKNVSIVPVNKADYVKAKAAKAMELEMLSSNSVGVVHFRPSNITKRMNYRPTKSNKPVESDDTQAEGTDEKAS